MRENNELDILTKEQVADLLKVKERSIDELRAKGMPFYQVSERVFRYSKTAILEWLETTEINSKYYI
ncbi:hypothetical protein P0Y35_16145 [Kiritimatiellaeota bacterium B1221]|nr:hypothetical protein [Kiritimatiellaeota bacterium B1221]